MKKLFCLLLCALVMTPTLFCAHAADAQSGTLRLIAYNVSGIPLVGDFQGSVFTTTNDRARRIGRMLNGTGVDFIGTEEDFNASKHLAAQMTNYPYHSFSSGGVAQGQGMNVFSSHPLYNIKRVKWDKEYGFVSGSNDALSNKGFLYSLMELREGVYIHVINLHMDAGYDPLSLRARISNFRQLADFIQNELDDGRALIVQGDFNYKFKRQLKDDLWGNLLEPTGLRDVWAEVYNGGLYDFTDPAFDLDSPGDDLDRILFRSGRDLVLTPVSKTVPDLTGENGERYSDHDPMLTEFAYTLTGETLSEPEARTAPVAENETVLALKEVGWMVVRFFQIVIGLVELPYLLAQAIELLINGKLP
ncbi:MAG: endonuclease/exonuclease/phosphatase family protein [Clostridia bacterium]|nr:endonuclease/exonuclease/phosphatase family protein [Clostridia bacterium]